MVSQLYVEGITDTVTHDIATTLTAGQITAAERDTFLRLNHDPSFVGNYPLLITAWGKKPNPPN